MYIQIKKVNNGWVTIVEGSVRGNDGTKVYKATEELVLLEDLGKVMLDVRIKAELR